MQLDTAAAITPAAASQFNVLAVSAAGQVCVWQCEVADSVKTTLRATIQVEQGSAET